MTENHKSVGGAPSSLPQLRVFLLRGGAFARQPARNSPRLFKLAYLLWLPAYRIPWSSHAGIWCTHHVHTLRSRCTTTQRCQRWPKAGGGDAAGLRLPTYRWLFFLRYRAVLRYAPGYRCARFVILITFFCLAEIFEDTFLGSKIEFYLFKKFLL